MPKPTASGPEPDQPYRDAMRDLIAIQWAAVWKAVPAVMTSDAPEAVHKLRVASRRLRAAMDVATDCFPRSWYRPLHQTAKAITRSLGEVRDRDVLLETLAQERAQASANDRLGIDVLIADLRRERKRARKALRRFLARLDSQQVPKHTKRRFSRPKAGRGTKKGMPADDRHPKRGRRHDAAPPDAEPSLVGHRVRLPSLAPTASLATNARRVLAVRIADLYRYAPIIPDATATELLHEARIATKRLRYTLELFPTVFGEDGTQAITHLQALQEELGQLHDRDVRMTRIEEEQPALASQPAAGLRPSLDALLERERAARARQHAAVVACWRRLAGEQLQERLLALTRAPA